MKKDIKMFIGLLLWSIVPSIVALLQTRMFYTNGVDINILGQIEWFDLIDEILVTMLVIPLYYLLKPEHTSPKKNTSLLVVATIIYMIFQMIVLVNIEFFTDFMNATNATQYLSMQVWGLSSNFILSICIVLFLQNAQSIYMYVLTIAKFVLTLGLNYILIPIFKELGVAYSDVIVNIFLLVIALYCLYKKGIIGFYGISFEGMKDYFKIGSYSGIQIFLDNFIYAVMICRMVNAVAASGDYWIANNFIWGWLLVPMNCLGEIIRKNKYDRLKGSNAWYFVLILIGIWIISIPIWGWFLEVVMSVEPCEPILNILYKSVPFYIFYLLSTCYSSWFISKGRTFYNTIVSFFVNIGYYGIAYILFLQGMFEMNIEFVIYLFGFGMAFNTLINVILYSIDANNKIKEKHLC